MSPQELRARTILLVVGGSRAYGLHTDASDVDLKGVAIPPREVVLGFRGRFEQADDVESVGVFADLLRGDEARAAQEQGLEGTVYELRKFLTLAVAANPNILDVLFCRDEDVRVCDELGRELRAAREWFVTARARQTFAGYATAQLKRIRNHRAWLLSPPDAPPERAEFGLAEQSVLPKGQLDAADAGLRSGALELGDNLVAVLQKERAFRAAQRAWQQYQHWKKHRNPARAALEAAYGYDTKHGAHLVRLLRMGFEILSTGQVHVWRGAGGPDDAEELRAIRAGAWSYDELVAYAEAQERRIAALVEDGRVVVPDEVDLAKVDELCVALMSRGITADSRPDRSKMRSESG